MRYLKSRLATALITLTITLKTVKQGQVQEVKVLDDAFAPY